MTALWTCGATLARLTKNGCGSSPCVRELGAVLFLLLLSFVLGSAGNWTVVRSYLLDTPCDPHYLHFLYPLTPSLRHVIFSFFMFFISSVSSLHCLSLARSFSSASGTIASRAGGPGIAPPAKPSGHQNPSRISPCSGSACSSGSGPRCLSHSPATVGDSCGCGRGCHHITVGRQCADLSLVSGP